MLNEPIIRIPSGSILVPSQGMFSVAQLPDVIPSNHSNFHILSPIHSTQLMIDRPIPTHINSNGYNPNQLTDLRQGQHPFSIFASHNNLDGLPHPNEVSNMNDMLNRSNPIEKDIIPQ